MKIYKDYDVNINKMDKAITEWENKYRESPCVFCESFSVAEIKRNSGEIIHLPFCSLKFRIAFETCNRFKQMKLISACQCIDPFLSTVSRKPG